MQSYLSYSYLWADDRDDQIQKFCATKPLIVEIKEMFTLYDKRIEEVSELVDVQKVGAVEINISKF